MLNLFQHLLPHRVRAYSAQDPDMRQDDGVCVMREKQVRHAGKTSTSCGKKKTRHAKKDSSC